MFFPIVSTRGEYPRNVLAGQRHFKERFFLGYNVAQGEWTLGARDMATGMIHHVSVTPEVTVEYDWVRDADVVSVSFFWNGPARIR